MKAFALTCGGAGKPENEDRLVIGGKVLAGGALTCELDNGILAVADGVGGNRAGEAAAEFVAEAIIGAATLGPETFEEINARLVEASRKDPTLEGMATTLSGIRFDSGSRTIFHVGNTRVYALVNGRYLRQLTTDDTTVQYLLSCGRLSPEEAAVFGRKNEITACFGGGNPSLLRLKILDLGEKPFPAFVLTSDGIHDFLSIDEMEDVLAASGGAYAEACEAISSRAAANGSGDDRSIIVAQT